MRYVYILKSLQKRWYYVGSTNNLRRRLNQYNKKIVTSTKHYAPLGLIFVEKFNTEQEAREYEKRLKKKRIEKELLIKQIENIHCGIV